MTLDTETALTAFRRITERSLRDVDRETRAACVTARSAIDELTRVLGALPEPSAQPTVCVRGLEWSMNTLATVGLQFAALAARCRDLAECQQLLTQLPDAAVAVTAAATPVGARRKP